MLEIWRKIDEYPDYCVSNLGRVKSYRYPSKGKILKGKIDKDGYQRILLYSEPGVRKMLAVHRLVAQAFIPNPHNYPIINHKDEDKGNNRADNLEWCTVLYNDNYGERTQKIRDTLKGRGSKFAGIKLIAYKEGHYKEFDSISEAARSLSVSGSDIDCLLKYGKSNYKHLKSLNGWQFVTPDNINSLDYSYHPVIQNRRDFKVIKGSYSRVFKTKSEASKALNIDPSYITKCLKSHKKGKGYQFEYI